MTVLNPIIVTQHALLSKQIGFLKDEEFQIVTNREKHMTSLKNMHKENENDWYPVGYPPSYLKLNIALNV